MTNRIGLPPLSGPAMGAIYQLCIRTSIGYKGRGLVWV
jgi:hypothetical protein